MRAVLVLLVLAGCATVDPAAQLAAQCQPEVDKVNAQLAAEVAERQRIVRAAARREETLRQQLDALKSIERGILEREERMQTQAR